MNAETYYKICTYLRNIIEGTQWENHVFTVGGCCRDVIMGNEINDVDLAVNLPNGGVELAQWLHQKKLTVGAPICFYKYGTARLSLKEFPQYEIELVQTRKEKYTKENSRCPEVAFGTLEDDCLRRDLTINTLYYNITSGETLDFSHKALDDIAAHRLRTPMDPDRTYDDDPVRILRTIRMAARYGWDIDPETMRAIYDNVDRLAIVSRERMHTELSKLLSEPGAVRGLRMLADTGALKYVIPRMELTVNTPDGKEEDGVPSVWEETLAELEGLKIPSGVSAEDAVNLKLAVLLRQIAKPAARVRDRFGNISFPRYAMRSADMARKDLRKLKFTPETLKLVSGLIAYGDTTEHWADFAQEMTDSELRRLQYRMGSYENFMMLLALINAQDVARGRKYHTAQIKKRTRQLMADGEDMFNFDSGLTDKEIIKAIPEEFRKQPEALHSAKKYLDTLAIDFPRRSKSEWKEELKKFNASNIITESSSEVHKKKHPKRRTGGSRKRNSAKPTRKRSVTRSS
ncbi:MAG: hypothetical protein K2M79_02265 [Muribaculaceae bacterium]|nr:hypothetical protein [Muribaculaceae bacterium]